MFIEVNLSQPFYSINETSGWLHGALISSKGLQEAYFIKLICTSGSALSKIRIWLCCLSYIIILTYIPYRLYGF